MIYRIIMINYHNLILIELRVYDSQGKRTVNDLLNYIKVLEKKHAAGLNIFFIPTTSCFDRKKIYFMTK